MSAVVALVLGDSEIRPYFEEFGYALNLIEPLMIDHRGQRFEPDVHLVNDLCNVSLLVECKTGSPGVRRRQLECYFNVDGPSIVEQGQLTLQEPRRHVVDPVFFAITSAVPDVTAAVREVVDSGLTVASGYGVVDVAADSMRLDLGTLTHGDLEASLSDGWPIDIWGLPLERIPYTAQSPQGEVAEFVLQALTEFFINGRETFTVDDVCVQSNLWWSYLGDHQNDIRKRVRDMLSQLRRTALRGWLDTSPAGGTVTRGWRFTRPPSTRANVAGALQRRAIRYIQLLKDNRDPRLEDFQDIEQLTLPDILRE